MRAPQLSVQRPRALTSSGRLSQLDTWETECRLNVSPGTVLKDQKATEKQTGQWWLPKAGGKGTGGGVAEGQEASAITMFGRAEGHHGNCS